ncbi:exonuclease 3'-5' domain-containing 2 [Oratosquilla oratoria]|uniref:exonuclease 3'-5' domain-containing 2 n=1 Tax=Oratosquilla oratoria TaxID=337810 RepID=UPI003F77132C
MVSSHQVVIGSALLGIAGVGAFLMYRGKTLSIFYRWRSKGILYGHKKENKIITSGKEWEKVAEAFKRECQQLGVVGFDCEWVQVKGHRRPVALLQLASSQGTCLLIRLALIKEELPESLTSFLKDTRVLKLGVGCNDDSIYLERDHSIQVQGCVDLRFIVQEQQKKSDTVKDANKGYDGLGLKSLAQTFLGITLNKDWRVRGSDWEAPVLTARQVSYAAADALCGAHICSKLVEQYLEYPWWMPFLPPSVLAAHIAAGIHQMCEGFRDVPFKKNKDKFLEPKPSVNITNKRCKSTYPADSLRKTPLYHNCQLRAPDNQLLCTCDPKKARWYVRKGLGTLVSEEPLVVKLNFEPVARPQEEGADGHFYIQVRENICVVCGKKDSYIRKNVVPSEYRKHFPGVLKHHVSHDVVLLCTRCHQLSNIRDSEMRFKLAEEFDAPIGTKGVHKVRIDPTIKSVKGAALILMAKRDALPENRVEELENLVRNYCNVDVITDDILKECSCLDPKIPNEDYVPHGFKVYQEYSKIGLIKMETRWRQHFLDSMKPSYMPNWWSVFHNHKKLRYKMSITSPKSPKWEDYHICLFGTEGVCDVEYKPKSDHISHSPETDLRNTDTQAEKLDYNPLLNAYDSSDEDECEESGMEYDDENLEEDCNVCNDIGDIGPDIAFSSRNQDLQESICEA